MQNEEIPLRVESIPAAWAGEHRAEDAIPAMQVPCWQLVYVRAGTVEERCDNRFALLRPGAVLLHQPDETFGMKIVGEIPPEILRLDFICMQPAMDVFRGAVFHADPQEQTDLRWMMEAVPAIFAPPSAPGLQPTLREEQLFGMRQQLAIHLENLLLQLYRRVKRPRRPTTRARREKQQAAIVEAARGYFSRNLEREIRIEDVCKDIGCSKPQLQAAFRSRLRHTAAEELAAMRIDFAAQLLARGAAPGEVAARLGYCSGAYFSQKFREATGNTPSAYRRMQQGLPMHRPKKQQKDKDISDTSIPEKAQTK